MDRSNFSGSHSKRQAGISESVQTAPQLGHPGAPPVKIVFENQPIRLKPRELRDPEKPMRRPATEMSWHGNPAVTIRESPVEHSEAERVDFVEPDCSPSHALGSDGESADSAEQVKVPHRPTP